MEPVATNALTKLTDSGVLGAILAIALIALAIVSGILIRVLLARAAEVKALAVEKETACKSCRTAYEAEIGRLNTARLDDLRRANEDAVRTLATTSQAVNALVERSDKLAERIERLTDEIRRLAIEQDQRPS